VCVCVLSWRPIQVVWPTQLRGWGRVHNLPLSSLRFGLDPILCIVYSVSGDRRSIPIFTGVPGNYGLVPLLVCRLTFTPIHRKLTIQFCFFAWRVPMFWGPERGININLVIRKIKVSDLRKTPTKKDLCKLSASGPLVAIWTSSEVAPMGAASVPEAWGTSFPPSSVCLCSRPLRTMVQLGCLMFRKCNFQISKTI